MVSIVAGIFTILHGLVHLLYVGQSARVFELQEGLVWPDGAWAFYRMLGNENTRMFVNVLLILAALIFVAAGIGLLVKQGWWQPVMVGAAAFSTIIYLLTWDGGWQNLPDKGGVGILINLALIVVVFISRRFN